MTGLMLPGALSGAAVAREKQVADLQTVLTCPCLKLRA